MSTPREHALAIWQAAVAAADPFERVRAYLSTLAPTGGITVFGGGKAGPAMARAVEVALADHLDRVNGIVNVPAGDYPALQRIHLWSARPAGSNQPTEQGVQGVDMQLSLAELLTPHDLALCLFSGGGSALLPGPVEGVTLADKQDITKQLHACGATIGEMNCVRKHLSRYKGGRLAQVIAQQGCRAVSLIVSDVVGDPLDVIASGPTAADPTTFALAWDVLTRYQLRIPDTIREHLQRGIEGIIPETPKKAIKEIENIVLCNNTTSLAAAHAHAEQLGYRVLNLGSYIEGETRPVAIAFAGLVRSIRRDGVPFPPPVCILSGGETSVTLGPNPGKGGRNQEFVLACLHKLGGEMRDVVILSAGTDGEDGPTDAAGAIVDEPTWRKIGERILVEYLDHHDAYTFFEPTGDLLKTGLTGTNVMDVRVLLVQPTARL